MRWLRSVAALLLIALTSASWAAPAEQDWCRNGLFPSEPPFALARVTGAERAYFHQDMDGCPDRGAACRETAYVVAGDRVVTNRRHGAYICAFYPGRGGGTAGWMQADRLAMQTVSMSPPQAAWLGRWSSAGNPEVRISAHGNTLRISGEAYWPGPKATANYPSPHIGEIGGELKRIGNRGHYGDEDDCEIEFTLLGDLLVAGDNRQCGGANVSFSAVYRRLRPAEKP